MDGFIRIKSTSDKIFAVIARCSQIVAACFLLIMIVDVSVQVVGRIAHFTLPVTEEIGTYSLIWMTYLASIAVTSKHEHLTVDLFLNRYSPRTKRIVRIIIDIMILIFCAMLMIFGYQLVGNKIIVNGRTPALQISRMWIYLSVPIAMTFNTLFMLYDSVIAIVDIGSKGKLTQIEEEAKQAELQAQEEAYQREAAEIKAAMMGLESGEEEE